MPFHVRLTPKSSRTRDEVKLDLDAEELKRRFLQPYAEGRPIVVGGRTVPSDDIGRLRISYTDDTAAQLLPRIRAKRAASGGIAPISDDWYVAAEGRDVTDEYIDGPPGHAITQPAVGENALPEPTPDTRTVFVVHGRNMRARDAMFSFLRSLNLAPMEFAEAIAATGRPSPYVGEILNAAFGRAAAVIVLLTPDDEARLRSEYRMSGDPTHEVSLTGQARPNVLFEAGMAIGRDEDRTVLVELGHTRPFSDIGGRHLLRIDNRTERRQELAQRLLAAGCDVNIAGTDWHKAGDFDGALAV